MTPRKLDDKLAEAATKTDVVINKHIESYNDIAFRSDTRPPRILFEFGFQRRMTTHDEYVQNRGENYEPTWRHGQRDMYPESAICLTQQFDAAPIFPVGSSDNPPSELTWIYIIRPQKAFMTHLYQKHLNSPLAFSEEIAVRDVPSCDVLAAIKCKRFWGVNIDNQKDWRTGVRYELISDLQWNPKNENVPLSDNNKNIRERIISLVEARHGKIIDCQVPQGPEEINYTTPMIIPHGDHLFMLDFKNFVTAIANGSATIKQDFPPYFVKSVVNTIILNDGGSVFFFAVQKGTPEIVKYLLDNGADLSLTDDNGKKVYDYVSSIEIQSLLQNHEHQQNSLLATLSLYSHPPTDTTPDNDQTHSSEHSPKSYKNSTK